MLSFIHKHYQSYASRSVPANKNVCKKLTSPRQQVCSCLKLFILVLFEFWSVKVLEL